MIMRKRASFDSSVIMHHTDDLMAAASNRYRITVLVANRAKQNRDLAASNHGETSTKPVLDAIVEISDELSQPGLIGDFDLV